MIILIKTSYEMTSINAIIYAYAYNKCSYMIATLQEKTHLHICTAIVHVMYIQLNEFVSYARLVYICSTYGIVYM